MKTILIFTFKFITYFIVLFVWFRFLMPPMLSYPDDVIFFVGVFSTIIFSLSWFYFFILTVNKFLNKLSNEDN